MSDFKNGDIVTALYKTGKYIGEVTDSRPGVYVVKVLAVLKHPRQGDLHNPKEVDVPLFHERKALAFRERANIPEKMVKPFEGDIPEYNESLSSTFNELKEQLASEDSAFAAKSLETLESIQREYELMYSIKL
ncbi:kinase [Rossellomorea vietnamensis]|jgi:kinase-associated protein B|uniref:Kinase n=1 Tax=Rossellomorea vietnamensis TaxID=218284 RepID=A0A5D4NIR4_9BACI|nr:kinase-associated lipoprotein B [Rossellomorea vietnamensis]TYS13411.1 kinase [Rossellomorea vietnamensis]